MYSSRELMVTEQNRRKGCDAIEQEHLTGATMVQSQSRRRQSYHAAKCNAAQQHEDGSAMRRLDAACISHDNR